MLNFATLADMLWTSTGRPLGEFLMGELTAVFGAAAAPHLREDFAHTRVDRRFKSSHSTPNMQTTLLVNGPGRAGGDDSGAN